MSKWTPAWLTCTKSAMSSSAWRNSCLVLLVRPHLTPCIRSGNPVTMRRSGAASKSVKLIAVKMSKAISRSRKHLATPVPCKCCRIQKNAFLQFSTLSGTSCSGNAFSNLVRVLETRARKLSRSSSSFAANPPWLPVTMTQPLGMQDPCPFAWQPHPFGLAIARPSACSLGRISQRLHGAECGFGRNSQKPSADKDRNCSSSEPNATRKENSACAIPNNFSALKRVSERRPTRKTQITLVT